MKKNILMFAIVAFEAIVIAVSSCSKDTSKSIEDQYKDFVEMFDDSTSYAIVNVGGQKVLLVSNETYQNEDADHKPIVTAVAAQVYGVDSAGKIIPYGEVRSQGTLYPVSIADGQIVTAGHHFIEKYSVDGALELKEDASAAYSTDGTATYSYENRDKNEYLDNCTEEKFDSLMNTASTPVEFVKDRK